MIIKICKHCNKEFKTSRSKRKFCSKACSNKSRLYTGWSTGKNNWNWKGGRYKTSLGYIWKLNRKHPNCNYRGYVMEHRLIMEKKIGRYLKYWELVHHLNGIKDDNRPENLEITTRQTHPIRGIIKCPYCNKSFPLDTLLDK